MARILGIDPGLQHTGWGIINIDGNNLRFVACGVIHSPKNKPIADRLRILHESLQDIILYHNPQETAIEETFVNKNALSSLKLGHARGVLLLTVSLAGIPVKEYAARLVKKTVVGTGAADKNQVMMMVKQLLPNADISDFDAADALAVAICHVNHRHFDSIICKEVV